MFATAARRALAAADDEETGSDKARCAAIVAIVGRLADQGVAWHVVPHLFGASIDEAKALADAEAREQAGPEGGPAGVEAALCACINLARACTQHATPAKDI